MNVSHSRSLVHSLIADIKDATSKNSGVLIKNELVGGENGLVSSTTRLSNFLVGDASAALKMWLQTCEEMLLDVLVRVSDISTIPIYDIVFYSDNGYSSEVLCTDSSYLCTQVSR